MSLSAVESAELRDRVARARLEPELANERRCAGCNGELEGHTKGCETCATRHYQRRYRENHQAPPLTCSGCGCAADDYTIGCRPCSWRHSARRRRTNAPVLNSDYLRIDGRLVHYTNADRKDLWSEIKTLRARLAGVRAALESNEAA